MHFLLFSFLKLYLGGKKNEKIKQKNRIKKNRKNGAS